MGALFRTEWQDRLDAQAMPPRISIPPGTSSSWIQLGSQVRQPSSEGARRV
jgi:hypothetical protein